MKKYFILFLIFLAVEQGQAVVKRNIFLTSEGKVREITPWERRGDELYLEWKLSEGQWDEIETYEKESQKIQESNYLFRKLGLVTLMQLFGLGGNYHRGIFGFVPQTKDLTRLLLSKKEEYLLSDLVGGTILAYLNKKEKIKVPQGKILLAFHVHTLYSGDSVQSIEKLLLDAEKKGFKAIVITDHDRIDGALEAIKIAEELKLQGQINDNFLVIIGEEISSSQGHIIGLFLRKSIPSGMTAKATIEAIHQQGGLAIAAHPNQGTPDNSIDVKLIEKLNFDAVEINSSVPKQSLPYYTYENSKLSNLGQFSFLFGGDDHISGSLGLVGTTVVETTEVSNEAIKRAFIEKRVNSYLLNSNLSSYLKFINYKLKLVYTGLEQYDNLKSIFENTVANFLSADFVGIYLNGDEPFYALANFYGFFTEFTLTKFKLKNNSHLRQPFQIKNIVTSWNNLYIEFVAPLKKEYKINLKYLIPLYR